jgi:hypothetical protein
MELDASGWSGEGAFTQVLIDALRTLSGIEFLKVEDAPASRADAGFSFISNEIFVGFARHGRERLTVASLSTFLETRPDIGAPDYEDEGMLQYLRTERIMRPYQTRGYKHVELIRIYQIGTPSRAAT